jgi:hypothetical protein
MDRLHAHVQVTGHAPNLAAHGRGKGLDSGRGRRAVAFAFGAPQGWQRFAVFFAASDGALFALCPVAPFGAGVPSSAAQALLDEGASSDDEAHSAVTQAWLQQVCPACRRLIPNQTTLQGPALLYPCLQGLPQLTRIPCTGRLLRVDALWPLAAGY